MPPTGRPQSRLMRLVFVTLEYDASTFSGNGIYAQSQVRGLLSCGHDVLIVCGQPSTTTTAPGASDKSSARVLRLDVDAERWGTLDRHSAWESFAREAAGSCVTTAVAEFQPHCVLAVDWSGVAAYEAMRTAAASDALATTARHPLSRRSRASYPCPDHAFPHRSGCNKRTDEHSDNRSKTDARANTALATTATK